MQRWPSSVRRRLPADRGRYEGDNAPRSHLKDLRPQHRSASMGIMLQLHAHAVASSSFAQWVRPAKALGSAPVSAGIRATQRTGSGSRTFWCGSPGTTPILPRTESRSKLRIRRRRVGRGRLRDAASRSVSAVEVRRSAPGRVTAASVRAVAPARLHAAAPSWRLALRASRPGRHR
jgi:hypothetical protein